MHKYFSEWYRPCHTNQTETLLTKRWGAVQAIKKFISPENAVNIVKIYLQKYSRPFLDEISAVCQKKDPAFPARKNELEISILVGSAIIDILEHESSTRADILSLGLLTYSFCDKRATDLIADMLLVPKDYLIKRTKSIRSCEKISKISTSTLNMAEDIDKLANAFDEEDITLLKEPTIIVLRKCQTSLKQVALDFNRVSAEMLKIVDHRREESEILWWVYPAFSSTLERPYCELSSVEACLIAGGELAELVITLPGPFSAKAFLVTVLQNCKGDVPVTVKTAVFAANETWRKGASTKIQTDDFLLFPLISAIHSSIELGDVDRWAPVFESKSELDPDNNFNLTDLSYQFYLENILHRILHQGGQ